MTNRLPGLGLIEAIRVRKKDLPPIHRLGDLSRALPPYKHLVGLIKRDGLQMPVFVDKHGYCVGGHYRLWAAAEAGLTRVPVVVVASEQEADDWVDRLAQEWEARLKK